MRNNLAGQQTEYRIQLPWMERGVSSSANLILQAGPSEPRVVRFYDSAALQ
jgi:hypothetical protein